MFSFLQNFWDIILVEGLTLSRKYGPNRDRRKSIPTEIETKLSRFLRFIRIYHRVLYLVTSGQNLTPDWTDKYNTVIGGLWTRCVRRSI